VVGGTAAASEVVASAAPVALAVGSWGRAGLVASGTGALPSGDGVLPLGDGALPSGDWLSLLGDEVSRLGDRVLVFDTGVFGWGKAFSSCSVS
jgi:hypothetical protein